MKVKIFVEDNIEQLEQSINEFLETRRVDAQSPHVEDIKYCMIQKDLWVKSASTFEYTSHAQGESYIYSAMVIYK